MKKPNKAILDGDIIAWKAAFVAEEEGPMAIRSLVSGIVDKWTPDGTVKVIIALSCKKKDNFRKDIFPAYKKNREGAYKPDCLSEVFNVMQEEHDCLIYPKLEADDVLGIYCSSGEGIAVTIDKDLKGVEGWHYNPEKEDEPRFVSDSEAEEWFCIQWMSGDSTDGIPGLWRVGKKTAEKFLDEWDEDEWHKNIIELYKEGKHVPQGDHGLENISLVMGQCVRILSHTNYDKETKEITMWSPKDGL